VGLDASLVWLLWYVRELQIPRATLCTACFGALLSKSAARLAAQL
jgi:hypothetical protein